jgi:hypothetical protein
MRRLAAIMVLAWMLSPGALQAIQPAGSVTRVQGQVTATLNGMPRTLFAGSTVLVGDLIETSFGARLQLMMNDGAVITLGETASFSVSSYETATDQGRGIVSVLQGAFLAASGALARLGPDRFQITTPTAVLGVRGTEVWGRMTGETMLEVAFLSGDSVVVTAGEQSVTMREPGSGVTVIAGQPLPRPKPWGQQRLQEAAQAVAFDD